MKHCNVPETEDPEVLMDRDRQVNVALIQEAFRVPGVQCVPLWVLMETWARSNHTLHSAGQ